MSYKIGEERGKPLFIWRRRSNTRILRGFGAILLILCNVFVLAVNYRERDRSPFDTDYES